MSGGGQSSSRPVSNGYNGSSKSKSGWDDQTPRQFHSRSNFHGGSQRKDQRSSYHDRHSDRSDRYSRSNRYDSRSDRDRRDRSSRDFHRSSNNRRHGPHTPPEPSSRSPSPAPAKDPPPGSEEERQQKIAETANKLKQSLSSITDEEKTNFLPGPPDKEETGGLPESSGSGGIPELRHGPPELQLTHDDFKDIGRTTVDSKIDFNEFSLASKDDNLGKKLLIVVNF